MLTNPIFVIGHPRSGTSLVRSLLERADDVWTIGREGKPIWEHNRLVELHPRTRGWQSNALDAEDATDELRASLTSSLLDAARRPGQEWSIDDKVSFLRFMAAQGVNPYYYDLPVRALLEAFGEMPPEGPPTTADGEELDEITPFCFPPRGARPTQAELTQGIRLIEKSIQSCFRVPFLRAMFSDAKYVFVVRDPKASIASLMDAWLHPRMFFSYKVPCQLRIRGYSDVFPWGRQWWNLSLPPGWRDLTDLRLEELCAENWRIHNEAVLAAFRQLEPTGNAVLVRYEDVSAEPARVMEQVAATTELPFAAAWRERSLPVVMTQTPPNPDKWRRHEREIHGVLPGVSSLAGEFGYETEVVRSTCVP
ncbi:sulfotransferase family protein [Micromonospora sp. NPDC051227]|uniref:sulfotransferase family protein n=1 Tax=Micromonospora sp. NPDC051227 TaxID=3364285 RepID=UPI00379F2238